MLGLRLRVGFRLWIGLELGFEAMDRARVEVMNRVRVEV